MNPSTIILRAQLLSILSETGMSVITIAWKNQILQFLTEHDEKYSHLQNGDPLELVIPQNSIQLRECSKGKSTALNRISCQLQQVKRYETFTRYEVIGEGTTFSIICPTEFSEELNWSHQMRLEMVLPQSGIQIRCLDLTINNPSPEVVSL